FGPESRTVKSSTDPFQPRAGWWNNLDKYIVSLLKAYYGDAARPENEFGFHWLPRITGDHSHQGYWLEMMDGKVEGLFIMGQNPAVGGAHSGLERRALAKPGGLVGRVFGDILRRAVLGRSPAMGRVERPAQTSPPQGLLVAGVRH